MTAATSSRSTSAEPLDRAAVIERALERRASLPAKASFVLAEQLRADGRFDHARAVLDDAEARHGASVGLLEQQARLAFTSGDHETALQCLQKRCDLWPSATASIALARFHLETGGIEEARRISDELLRTDPNLLTVQALAGAIARADGDLKGARTFFLAMVDLRTEHPGALLTLAELSFEDGDADSARAFYRRAVAAIAASDPRPAGVLPDAAKIAHLLGDDIQADAFATEAESTQSDRAMTALAVLAAAADSAGSIGATVRDSAPHASAPSPRTELPDPTDLETFEAPPAAGIQADDPRVLQTLRALFGHEALRPGQAEVINQVMAGVDTLAVMPTGAGKSLTFQLPAMIQDGVTVVISPLIALMKDQVDGLPPAVQAKTALINSTLSLEEMRLRLDHLRRGELKLIYVAPERLRQHGFLKALRQVKIATFVVDEAHCISMWGHDFRPDYLFIPRALKEIGEPPVLAITATATQATARFIADGLERKLALVRTSVYRPNLFYSVTHCATRDKKVEAMVEFCRKERGSGIVYVSSRRDAEDLAGLLRSRGVSAGYYHAGMNPDARRSAQEAFMSGQVRVVVATVAFGMGIDKSDVRFIVRFSPPASLEAYAQESGRAGRDGQPAKCLLLIAKSDESTLKRLSKQDRIEIGELRRVYQAIRRQANGRWAIIDVASLQNYSEDEASDPRIALGLLDQARLIRRHPDAAGTLQLRFRPGALDALGLGPDQADALSRLKSWLGSEALAVGGLPIETASACDAIGIAPVELDRLLADIPDVAVREGSRGTCLELLPAGPNAGATMQSLLDKAQADAVERIDRVMAFAEGRRCRHQMLAAHLGEQLAPCKTQCDVCTGTVAARVVADHARGRKETPADRLVVLQALQTAPYSLGAPSLIKLLTGSAESKIQRDRSASFGALSDLAKSAIQRLIDSLIDDGLIERYERDGYRLLAISRAGADQLGVRYMAP